MILWYNTLILKKLYGENMTNFENVEKFVRTFGQEVKTKAGFPKR